MNIKRQLHTIYLKYDTEFKTLSKKALAQIILKIIHIAKTGASFKHLSNELSRVLIGSINEREIQEAIRILEREKKVNHKNNKYYIHEQYKNAVVAADDETNKLHDFVFNKYFSKCESKKEDILNWFQDTTIRFLEQFSYEWFHQATYKSKIKSSHVEHLAEIVNETLLKAHGIVDADKDWLKSQYTKFIDSEEHNESLILWYYGISMFSSRLITAQSRADDISIDPFKNSKFILDTNVLMVLDLEAHDLHKSFQVLEKILIELKVSLIYFHTTRDEYIRAMSYRKEETIRVFENYDLNVLKASDCPFISTAFRRQCKNGDDVKNMFEKLIDVPEYLFESLRIERYESAEIIEALEEGQNNESLKDKINEIAKRRTKRDKRERPKTHDAGMIQGASKLRTSDNCWIITSDSILKIYAIENCLRDENEIAIGLDVLLGMLAVNSAGNGIDASNFAPLFKNIIKLSLIPENDTFQVQDLAFILDANLKINELGEEKVKEIAREVKRMRIRGEADEMISLYLRRQLEGEKLVLNEDLEQSLERERIAKLQKAKSDRERDIFIDGYRTRRKGELQDKYERDLRNNRLSLFAIPVVIGVIIFATIKLLLPNQSGLYQFLGGAALELVFGLLPLIPLRKRIFKKYSEYVIGINVVIENEILDLRKKAEE